MGVRQDVDVWDGTAALRRTRRSSRRRAAARVGAAVAVVAAVVAIVALTTGGGEEPWDPVPVAPTSVPAAGESDATPPAGATPQDAPPSTAGEGPATGVSPTVSPTVPSGEAPSTAGSQPAAPGTTVAPAEPVPTTPDVAGTVEPPNPGTGRSSRPSGLDGGITTS